ncbi:pyrroline-5-carboxylate reductase [Aerococcaceae bacterium DSM 111020]|nr:pyrroline-5-carboxylate reductase [Aerococcaceae bacterium DSM 111020]
MINTVGFIGVGNMAQQLVKAVRHAHPTKQLFFNSAHKENIAGFAKEMDAEIVSKEELVTQSDMIFIGVKPYQIADVFQEIDLSPSQDDMLDKIWISMAVSVSLADLQSMTVPNDLKWIRMMPNLPVGLGKGTIGYIGNDKMNETDEEAFLKVMEAAGLVVSISEDLFDIYGAIAGSGPAFIFQIIEAMSDAGVRHGLSRQQAIEIAAQTVSGAAELLLESGEHPGVLKDQVTSPNGTTIAGVVSMEESGLRCAMMKGIEATYQRSIELAKGD